jgi:MinD-like ATPase involved in chromosome partitioning or flagellar assembly
MAKSFWRCPEFKNRKQIGDLEKRILLLSQKNDCTVFSFTGCRGGEGVSTIIVNLINYLAATESEKKALVIDANFKAPVLHDALGKNLGHGLSDILKGTSTWSDAVTSTDFENVHFLSCGSAYQQMEGNLEQAKQGSVLAEIRGMYDYVLVDSPAILTSADSLTVAVASDATLLVIQSLNTPKEVADRARSLLVDNECFMAGVLLNRVKQVIPGWMYRML